jgi:hydrogenase maturation factor
MPTETKGAGFKTMVDAIKWATLGLSIAIVGGHTGYNPGFADPTIGSVIVFAVADKSRSVHPMPLCVA